MGSERKQPAREVLLVNQAGPQGTREGNGQLGALVVRHFAGCETQRGLIVSIERRLYTIRLRLRSLFRRDRVESELDEELAYHIDRQIQEGVREGLSP